MKSPVVRSQQSLRHKPTGGALDRVFVYNFEPRQELPLALQKLRTNEDTTLFPLFAGSRITIAAHVMVLL